MLVSLGSEPHVHVDVQVNARFLLLRDTERKQLQVISNNQVIISGGAFLLSFWVFEFQYIGVKTDIFKADISKIELLKPNYLNGWTAPQLKGKNCVWFVVNSL